MPQHKSAIKRMRQNAKRRAHNRAQRSRMRTLIKKIQGMEDKEQAESLLPEVKSYIDRLAGKGLIHQNKAARYKSKLDKHLQDLE